MTTQGVPEVLGKLNRNTRPSVWWYVACVAATALVYVSRSPAFLPAPFINSATFLHVGQTLVDGGVPYRDAWDHKGPLLYLLNAAGLVTGGRWGVWVLETAMLGSGVALVLGAVWRAAGRDVAIVCVLLMLLGVSTVQDMGNKTESYSIVFHALALWACCCMPSRSWRPAMIIGVCVAACFWLRPNNVALPAAASLVLGGAAWRHGGWRAAVRCAAWGVGTFAIVGVMIVLATVGVDGVDEMVDAYVVFNLMYSGGSSWSGRIGSVAAGFHRTGLVAWVASVSWVLIAAYLLWGRLPGVAHVGAKTRRLITVCLIAWPLAIVANCVSGFTWPHYYLMWLPTAAATSAWVLIVARRWIGTLRVGARPALPNVTAVVVVALIVALVIAVVDMHRKVGDGAAEWRTLAAELDPYVRGRSHLLVWGNDPRPNVAFDVPPPGRFVYIYPLIHTAYVRPEMIDQTRRDIDRTRPLIIDASGTNPRVPPIDPQRRRTWTPRKEEWNTTPALDALIEQIQRSYEPIGRVESVDWVIYAPADER